MACSKRKDVVAPDTGAFQSHFGLILSLPKDVQQKVKITFQSHFGLILSLMS